MSQPTRSEQPAVGQDEPQTPTHSLPSYDEPTAETNRPLTREEEAELALTRTVFTSGTRGVLIAAFLLTIVSVPLLQLISERRSSQLAQSTVASELTKLWPNRSQRAKHDFLPHADTIKAAEKSIERESVVSRWLLPRAQSLLTNSLGAGNEQAYIGQDGWLFYRPDVEYVTGAPFLDGERLRHRSRSGLQPDPVRAIAEFRDQLAARGAELIVVPAPAKPSIDGEQLSSGANGDQNLQNPSFEEWKGRLAREGVQVFDPAPLLHARKQAAGGAPQYLATDTHWRPEAMEAVAAELARHVKLEPIAGAKFEVKTQELTGLGDLFGMLKIPANQQNFAREAVTIHQVKEREGGLWRPVKEADVLLLGDSFANIFSLASMGWGESAGFAEQLSRALGGRPLDCILRNSDGAFATREILSHELARGRDRLAGKRVVIWEFAARELAIGDWKLLPMKLEEPKPARFFCPKPGEEVVVTGTVDSTSPVPQPNSVPYKDHVLSIHLVDLDGLTSSSGESAQALVYLWSMRDNVWTSAARLRAGDRVTVKLRAWSEVSAQYEKFNRSEIDDPAVQLEEPAWGELVP